MSWKGESNRHAMAARGIKSVERFSETMADIDYRPIDYATWSEYLVEASNEEKAKDFVGNHEMYKRLDNLTEIYKERLNQYNNMSKAAQQETLEDFEMTETEFLKDIKDNYLAKQRIVIEVCASRNYFDDEVQKENGMYKVTVYSDAIDREVNRIARLKGVYF